MAKIDEKSEKSLKKAVKKESVSHKAVKPKSKRVVEKIVESEEKDFVEVEPVKKAAGEDFRVKMHSKRNPSTVSPSWVEYKPKEIVDVIVSLSNQGNSSSEIGLILRDQYGVPNVRALAEKSIEDILAENNLLPKIPEDLMSLIRKSVNLKSHMEKNKKDFSAKHGYMLTVSKIRKLVRYYHDKKRLPLDWRFSEETAALLVK